MSINNLIQLKRFEDECLGLIQPAAQPVPSGQEVWCYDFDGVVHTKMKSGENMTTDHRNPDHGWLKSNFTSTNFISLLPYIFSKTINHMKYGQSIGAKIVIVSANSLSYKDPIFNLLKYLGINIGLNDINMKKTNKVPELQKLRCTLFMDDSCKNITEIYNAYKSNPSIIPTLKKLVFVVPEKEKELYSQTHYEIDLNKSLNICNKPGWDKKLLSNSRIKLLDFPSKMFSFTSWNVYYKLTNPTSPQRLNYIKEYLSKSFRKPDILFTQESQFDLPTNTFSNYKKIYWYNPGKSAICTHFDNSIFRLNNPIVKLGFNDHTHRIDFKKDNNIQDQVGTSSRPILAIKLTHIQTNKDIIFINLWAPHDINVKNTGKLNNFLTALNEIINNLYTDNERIIIAGDFNEFYEDSKTKTGYSVDILKLKGVDLFLKQRENTCCGDVDKVNTAAGLFHNIQPMSPYDLLYDSDPVGSVVRVGTSKISDHLPISAYITI